MCRGSILIKCLFLIIQYKYLCIYYYFFNKAFKLAIREKLKGALYLDDSGQVLQFREGSNLKLDLASRLDEKKKKNKITNVLVNAWVIKP